MSLESSMREKLVVALEPRRLDVINESELHAGHREGPGTSDSHFRVLIVSDRFEGRSRLDRHRLVNELLADELKDGGIHALALKTLTPQEAEAQGI